MCSIENADLLMLALLITFLLITFLSTDTVDGDWSRWTAWSQCSVTCEKGVQSRTRMCNNPTPRNGGRECEGKNTDKRSCVKRSCSFG